MCHRIRLLLNKWLEIDGDATIPILKRNICQRLNHETLYKASPTI